MITVFSGGTGTPKLIQGIKEIFPEDSLDELEAAEKQYQDLLDQAFAQAVIDKINNIGKVKYPTSEAAIKDARDAYDALTDAQKAIVPNIDVLKAKEADYKYFDDHAKAEVVNSLIDEIGEPKNRTLSPSCATEGEDGVYEWEGLIVYTQSREVGAQQIIVDIE